MRLFADGCKIYRKITNKNDIENLHKDLDTLGGECVVENGMKINCGKYKAIRFTKVWVKIPLCYTPDDQKFRMRAVLNTWKEYCETIYIEWTN